MAALTQVQSNIWRWDGVDADHGFPIVGYAVDISGDLVLIDPPGTSGSKEEIEAIGIPKGILITNMWHVRGSVKWADAFGIKTYAPASADSEFSEAGGKIDVVVDEDSVHHGWRAIRHTVTHEGKTAFDEINYWHEASRTIVVGDLFTEDEEGRIGYGPHAFGGVPVELLHPLVERLASVNPKLMLSAHLGPREDVSQIFDAALAL